MEERWKSLTATTVRLHVVENLYFDIMFPLIQQQTIEWFL